MTARWRGLAKRHLPLVAVLVAATAAVYLPALRHRFHTTWDDDTYVVVNEAVRGFSWPHLKLAFTTSYAGNYAPLQIVSYMADYTVWGMRSAGFIGTNLLLHLANGLLFYRLLLLLAFRRTAAFFAAAVFLLHPVQVETVAWIAQRKNLLAMTFFLLSFLVYTRSAEKKGGEAAKLSAASLLLFVAALLTKAVTVVLPLALILYDHCYLPEGGRRRWPGKLPFFAAAAAVGLLALKTQAPEAGGGLTGYHGGSPLATFLTMVPVLVDYLRLCLWPLELSASYAPTIRTSSDLVVAAAGLLLSLLFLAGACLHRRDRRLFFWLGFFFLALLPVSQIVPLVTLMNDRYLYFPLLGFAALSAGLVFRPVATPRWQQGATAAALVLLLLLGATARQRLAVWQDDMTLWRDAVTKSPGSAEAWSQLGATLQEREDFVAALSAYRRSLAINPVHSPTLNNIALCYTRLGNPVTGRRYLLLVTQKYPQLATGFLNLGHNYQRAGEYVEAEKAYLRLMALQPDSPEPRLELARLHVNMRKPELARLYYRQALARGGDPSEAEKGLLAIDALYGGTEKR